MTPMTRIAAVPLAALGLALAACGGATSSSAFAANAPTSASMSVEVAGTTTTPATLPADPTTSVLPTASAGVDGPCHPHLFVRTAEVVARVNGIMYRHLRHVDALLAHHPKIEAGDSVTWSETGSGADPQRQFTMSRSADGLTWTFELDLAPAGQTPPSWTKVFWGSTTDSKTGDVAERKGTLNFDEDALHAVIPAEPLTGTVVVTIDRLHDPSKPGLGVKRLTDVAFTGFSFGPLDLHGPRSGGYTHLGEPGVGGLVTYDDELILLCPANPSRLAAETTTVARWYRAADGSVHGRADARATGGQNPAGDTWMGLTCHSGAEGSDPATAMETGYWMMKLEDSTGATAKDGGGNLIAHQAGSGVACDAAFGAVPALDGNATDYDFTAPVSFPNEW